MGVVWKWELHMGSEVEAMWTQWYRSGSEEELVEHVGQRQVYTIRASLVVCREWYKHRGIQGTIGKHQKESVAWDMSHGEWERAWGDWKGSGRGSRTRGGSSEQLEGVGIIRIGRKKEEKGNIIALISVVKRIPHNPPLLSASTHGSSVQLWGLHSQPPSNPLIPSPAPHDLWLVIWTLSNAMCLYPMFPCVCMTLCTLLDSSLWCRPTSTLHPPLMLPHTPSHATTLTWPPPHCLCVSSTSTPPLPPLLSTFFFFFFFFGWVREVALPLSLWGVLWGKWSPGPLIRISLQTQHPIIRHRLFSRTLPTITCRNLV